MAVRFNSAVDWWLWAVIAFVVVTVCYAVFVSLKTGNKVVIASSVAAALLGVGLPVWLTFATYYLVDEQQLTIRSGPFTWRIELESIERVVPSRSTISSPALSLNRLEISYGKHHTVLVSPEDRTGFLQAIGQLQYSTAARQVRRAGRLGPASTAR